jgi:hypothetical protein
MTETSTSIVNLALVELGNGPIPDFHAPDKAARIARVVYEPTVRDMLREHPWRFARRTALLTPDPAYGDPLLSFAFAHRLPEDFISIVYLDDRQTAFARHRMHLLVDNEAPELTYIARVPESDFDPAFVSALVYRLAGRMCKAITDSDGQREVLMRNYAGKLQDAKAADAMDGSPEERLMGNLEQVRL